MKRLPTLTLPFAWTLVWLTATAARCEDGIPAAVAIGLQGQPASFAAASRPDNLGRAGPSRAFRYADRKLMQIARELLVSSGAEPLSGDLPAQRHLGDREWVGNAQHSPELRKFLAAAPLVQEYARRYGFDWLLIMSQAYQESRLDQSALSSKGAVGIMQVLPSTAADPNVGIPDISTLENNIHAGNKYLRFVRDRYFDPEPMSELDKTLFAFAAYNAGPARISSLRAEAAGEGLDPNVWFDNVERIAARRIGRETVDYVANIYRYWIALRLQRGQRGRSVPVEVASRSPPGVERAESVELAAVICRLESDGDVRCEPIEQHGISRLAGGVDGALDARIRGQRHALLLRRRGPPG